MNTIRLFACFLALLVFGGILPGNALAGPHLAPSVSEAVAVDPPTLTKHLRTELRSEDPIRQSRALVDIITLAGCPETCTVHLQSASDKKLRVENETGMGNAIDLDALVPDLMSAYREGPVDGTRLLALSALIKVGNEKAFEQLIDEKEGQSENVQKATNRSLASFYLEKYPELTERAFRSGNLTIDDVRRAERLRLRLVRKAAKG
jgi:hypothetical protein